METFQAEHELADVHYYNHRKDGRSFMHSVGCGKFYCWVYHNGKDIDPAKELRIFNSLHNQHELKELGSTKFLFQYAPAEDYEHYENSLFFFSVNIKKGLTKENF